MLRVFFLYLIVKKMCLTCMTKCTLLKDQNGDIIILQLEHPERVDSLALVNSTVGKAGWTEWGYQKVRV